MSSILIGLFTFALIIVCLLLVLVILMQRPNANAGMGASLGGGAAENVFGGEAGNVLTKATVRLTVLFFVISAGLYFGYIYTANLSEDTAPKTVSISAVTEKTTTPKADASAKAPATPAAATPKTDAKK